MGELVRQTLADQVYDALHLRIMNGELTAGARLLPEELASAMLISPTPIKEALVRLQTEGLVENATRRGATVRRFGAADVRELYEARMVIEHHALEQGARDGRLGRPLADQLEILHRRHGAALARQAPDGLREALCLDRAIHERLVALADNRVMADWHRRVMAQTHTIRVYSLKNYGRQRLLAEHGAIIAAVREQNLPAAQRALHDHLSLSSQELQSRVAPGAGAS